MVTWFDESSGGLAQVLRDVAGRRFTGAVAVSGRGDGGHVWLRDGAVIGARTDDQPSLPAAIVAAGVADAATAAELGRTRGHGGAPAGVVAVAEELAMEALGQLTSLHEGSVREMPDDRPAIDGLFSLSVGEVLGQLTAYRARRRVRELGRRGQWCLAAPGGDVHLRAEEWALVQALTRSLTATDIAAATDRDFGEVSTLLRRLSERGLVQRETGSQATPAPRAPVEPTPATDEAPRRTTTQGRTPAPPRRPQEQGQPTPVPRRSAPARSPAGGVPTTTPATPATTASSDDGGGSRASALRRLIGAVRAG